MHIYTQLIRGLPTNKNGEIMSSHLHEDCPWLRVNKDGTCPDEEKKRRLAILDEHPLPDADVMGSGWRQGFYLTVFCKIKFKL